MEECDAEVQILRVFEGSSTGATGIWQMDKSKSYWQEEEFGAVKHESAGDPENKYNCKMWNILDKNSELDLTKDTPGSKLTKTM